MHRSRSVGGHLRLFFAVWSLFLECSRSQEAAVEADVPDEGAPDVTNPCSCDCCLVAERKPSEIAKTPSGVTLTRKCVSPPPAYQTESCPAACIPNGADIVLTASVKVMDYGRFCTYKCKPLTKIPGTTCEALQSSEIAQVFSMDGNGNADTDAFIPRDTSMSGFPGTGGGVALGPGSGGGGGAGTKGTDTKTSEHKEDIKYDYRKVISNRIRAEAAANIARAAAEEAYTKASREATEHNAKTVAKATTAIGASDGAAGAAQAAAAQQALNAGIASATARSALLEGRSAANAAAKEAKALARQEVYKAVQADAKVEAEADMFRYGWDKPPNWPKVVAQQNAMLYLSPMVGAIWRASEYEGYAKGILGQASGAQGKAKALMKQANMYRATGDQFEAKVLEEEVQGLIKKSHALEDQAQAEWSKANRVQQSVAEWQQGAVLAAGHGGWAWAQYFSPPPPPGLPPGLAWRAKFRFAGGR